MKNILPGLATTVLLYGGALGALLLSDRLNPSATDAGTGQSILVLGAVGIVLLAAFAYALYRAVAQSPQWWAVVGLHIVLAGICMAVMAR